MYAYPETALDGRAAEPTGAGTHRRPAGPAITVHGPAGEAAVLLPATRTAGRGSRTIGTYVLLDGRLRFVPAVDVERVAVAGLAAAALVVVGVTAALARRRGPAIGAVTMGPGGWVSVKGAPVAGLRAAGSSHVRPWWARLLGARRLVVEA